MFSYILKSNGEEVKGAKLGALVYPSQEDKEYKCWKLNGYGGIYAKMPINIPQPKDMQQNDNDTTKYTRFCKEMKAKEDSIERMISDILNINSKA